MRDFIKEMLKISAFYLDKQKSFIPKKKYEVYQVSRIVLISANRWQLDVLTFLIQGYLTHVFKINPKRCEPASRRPTLKIVKQACTERERAKSSQLT